jgi:uncharacterized SAM-binding protein YcdF (DUF218 family)
MNKKFLFFNSFVLLVAGCMYLFLNIGNWLTTGENPRKADIIICLNLSNARIQKAVDLYNRGYSGKILATFPSSRDKIIKHGVAAKDVLSLYTLHNSTFEEAIHAIEFLHRQNLRSALIVTDPFHMYRAKWTYRHLNEKDAIELTYTAAEHLQSPDMWWRERKDRRFVLTEIPKIAYYWIAHGLLGVTYDPKWIIVTERWYCNLLKHFV